MEFTIQGFYVGTFFVRYYGIILMLGTVLGAWLAAREATRRGYDSETVWDMLIWLIVGGVIGARLWHVFTPTPSAIAEGRTTIFYLTHPFDLINLRNGGLGIVGAIIGGVITMYLYTRRHTLNFAVWIDVAAPAVALGQAIGRWGNFVNQELYGAPTDLPWKIYIEPQHRLSGFEPQEYYHPLFLYESLWNLANMALLLWLMRRHGERLKNGDIFIVYLVVYPIGRFLLEFLRLDSSILGGLNANQAAMAVVAVLSATALFWRHKEEFIRKNRLAD